MPCMQPSTGGHSTRQPPCHPPVPLQLPPGEQMHQTLLVQPGGAACQGSMCLAASPRSDANPTLADAACYVTHKACPAMRAQLNRALQPAACTEAIHAPLCTTTVVHNHTLLESGLQACKSLALHSCLHGEMPRIVHIAVADTASYHCAVLC